MSKALEAAKEEAHLMLELIESRNLITYTEQIEFVDALVGKIIRAYAENITNKTTKTTPTTPKPTTQTTPQKTKPKTPHTITPSDRRIAEAPRAWALKTDTGSFIVVSLTERGAWNLDGVPYSKTNRVNGGWRAVPVAIVELEKGE